MPHCYKLHALPETPYTGYANFKLAANQHDTVMMTIINSNKHSSLQIKEKITGATAYACKPHP